MVYRNREHLHQIFLKQKRIILYDANVNSILSTKFNDALVNSILSTKFNFYESQTV